MLDILNKYKSFYIITIAYAVLLYALFDLENLHMEIIAPITLSALVYFSIIAYYKCVHVRIHISIYGLLIQGSVPYLIFLFIYPYLSTTSIVFLTFAAVMLLAILFDIFVNRHETIRLYVTVRGFVAIGLITALLFTSIIPKHSSDTIKHDTHAANNCYIEIAI